MTQTAALNIFDYIVILTLIISAILAFMRGFVAEVLSIAGWVGAALITLYAYPHAAPLVKVYIANETISNIVTGVGCFIFALVILNLIFGRVSKSVKGSTLNAIDRSLGFLFGLARGALIVCLAYMLINWLWPAPNQPDWLTQARSLTLIKSGAEKLEHITPDLGNKEANDTLHSAEETVKNALEAQDALKRLSTPTPVQQPKKEGYQPQDQNDLNRLMDQVK